MNRNFIHRIVELTNTQRRQAGLPELRFNPVLAAAAQKHSVDMALEDFFSHNSPDGSKVSIAPKLKAIHQPLSVKTFMQVVLNQKTLSKDG